MVKKRNRFIYMFIAGIFISMLLHAIVPFPEHDHSRIYDFLISIFITIIVWEGNLQIDIRMNEKYPWVAAPLKRLLLHLLVSLVFSVLGIYLPMFFYNKYICNVPAVNKGALMTMSVVVGVLITIIILTIEISTQFFNNWKNSLLEVEKYKTESAQAQLENLKSQINPHFLFNNMSVLSSLVYKDQDKAVDFINQLSKVYRYLLDNKGNELVSLQTELAFIKSYTYLLQIRFDTNIEFDFQIPSHAQQLLIPPMALQMLIENAIKHNEVSSEQPLKVSIIADTQFVTVSNNLQLRSNTEPGSKTGLRNIRERYKFYTTAQVEVIENGNEYSVKLPLLNTK